MTKVGLSKPGLSILPENWLIEFRSPNTTHKLSISGLRDYAERQWILEALNKWAPNAERDPQLLLALQNPTLRSYTELWLQSLSGAPKRDRLKPLSPGVCLKQGRYRIIEQIGAGGQGIAYLAEHIEDQQQAGRIEDKQRAVVLKEFIMPVYLEIAARRRAVERLNREAQLLASIDHPQIATLRDFFIEDHRGYLVLEHIEGETLRQLVYRVGPLNELHAIKLGLQMCDILECLDGKSPPVVHRDFTPENLIVRNSGLLTLIDFAVAQKEIESTKTVTVVGKPPYMSAEQIRGEASPRSDIYALGATMFFLLTGHDPEPLTPSRPQTFNSAVSHALDKVIEKSTTMQEEGRYQNVAELERAFHSILACEQ